MDRARPPELADDRQTATPAPTFPIGGAGGVQLMYDLIAAGAYGGWSGGATSGGWSPFYENDVLAIPAVSASLALLASFVTQMPLEAVDTSTTPATVLQPTPPLLRCPTGDPRGSGDTLGDWVEGVLRDLALWGTHVAVIGDRSWDGWPRVMYPVRAGWWQCLVEGGRVFYEIGGERYDPADIFHVEINRNSGELIGRGLLSNRELVAAAVMAERFATNYFATGTVPSVHVQHPNPDLTQPQADDLKAKFLASVGGSREPVVTPLGTTITVLPNDAQAAQLVEARKWNNQALAMALGVPAAMLGLDTAGMIYRNLTQVNQQFISTTVMRYLVPIEQQLTAQCLPRGIDARFDTSALLRPDVNDRSAQAIALYQAGIITLDEARADIDRQPSDDLNAATVTPSSPTVPALTLPTSLAGEQTGGGGDVSSSAGLALIGGG